MRIFLRRLCLAAALTLCCTVCVFAQSGLQTVVDELRQEYDLNTENFSLCYYNTVTGEAYQYNPDAWMIAGSTYKLPLHMYYCDLQASGALPAYYTAERLEKAQYESMVNSNNEISEAMSTAIGGYRAFKKTVIAAYGGLEESEVPQSAWGTNDFSARCMENTLLYLYEHAQQYDRIIAYMKLAQPDNYFKRDVREYEIAHKYGWYDGAVNDVGIVYTPQPYLLAVFTYDVQEPTDPEALLGTINARVCAYNVEQANRQERERRLAATAVELAQEQAQDRGAVNQMAYAAAAAATLRPQPQQERSAPMRVLVWIPAAVLLLLAAAAVFVKKRRRKKAAANET